MKRSVNGISSVLGVLATLATILMMIAIVIDVVNRAVSGRSVPGILELSETALVAAVFLGMAYTGATNGHISVDLLTSKLPDKISRWLIAFGWVATAVILAWLLYATALRAVASTQSNEVRMGLVNWPLWPARWIIVIGLAAMLLVALTNVVRTLGGKEVLGYKDLLTIATDTATFAVAADERASLSSLGAVNEPVSWPEDEADDEKNLRADHE